MARSAAAVAILTMLVAVPVAAADLVVGPHEPIKTLAAAVTQAQPGDTIKLQAGEYDDDFAVIGSSNMDIRSFSLNMEVSLMVLGKSFVQGMREVEQDYRDAGRRLTLEEWRKEPGKATFLDGMARLTSALN